MMVLPIIPRNNKTLRRKDITQQATNAMKLKLKFSPQQVILFHKPGIKMDGNDATMKVNGKNVPPKIMPCIHPKTTSKKNGVTPCHMVTDHLMEMVQLVEVNPLQGVATILYPGAQSDLDGGMYCPMGFGSIPPGPKQDQKYLGNLQFHHSRQRRITRRKNHCTTTTKTRST